MKSPAFLSSRILRFLLGSVLFLLSCHLGQDEKVENTLSFTSLYDSLSKYDTVTIEVKDASGKVLGVIYHGGVDSRADIEKLSVPEWDGGKITISITGYMAGSSEPVYKEEKRFDGKTNKVDSVVILKHPNPGLSAATLILQLNEGQMVLLPAVEVHPTSLADKALRWSSSNPAVAAIQNGFLKAGVRGTATVTVKLNYDSLKILDFEVQVASDPKAPESLTLDRDTLHLAENGAPGRFEVDIRPLGADLDVVWRIGDSTIAAPRQDGAFQGLKIGITKVWAASKSKPTIQDSAFIRVSEPVLVQSVRFVKESLELFVGGAGEDLVVEVLPLEANQEVEFSVADAGKASLAGSKLTPVAAGATTVMVKSRENPSLSDTLVVTVTKPVQVERVEVSVKALTLYRGGIGQTVSAAVHPSNAPGGVQWESLTPAVASVSAQGEIKPLQAGLSLVVAISRADSLKRDTIKVSVKVDAPQLNPGLDTTVSAGQTLSFLPTATQEYGQIVVFKWDLDGNPAWDDSSASIKAVSYKYDQPKEYAVRFLVRDTEGNEVIATQRVNVVTGAAVVIHAPANNSYTNKKVISVRWSVNSKDQDSLLIQNLNVGANTITRSARDSAGKVFTASITVHLDTLPPSAPKLAGTSPTNTKPKWTWSAGGGGSGDFWFRLGDGNFPADAPTTRDSSYTLAADPVSGTTYTLFIQERDAAGNWSSPASLAIKYDVTKPVVTLVSPLASGTHFTAAAGTVLSGTASGPLPVTGVTYKVGNAAAANATFSSGNWITPSIPLLEGTATLVTVTAVDNAGNTGEAQLTLFRDNTAPSAPVITIAPSATTNKVTGSFAWNVGSDGTTGSGLNGRYRYNLNAGTWKDTGATLLSDLPLAEGNNVFSVQGQDKAGNWSASATSAVKVDATGPTITLTSHANPAALAALSVTLAGSVQDALTSVASMSVSGQVSGSGTVTVTGASWTTANLTLQAGANTLVLTATDLVGNTRNLNVVVNVNVPAPKVIITSPADNTTLTNKDTVRVFYTLDGAARNQLFNLTEGNNSLVVSSPANESGNIGRDTVSVRRDGTAPLAPALTVDAAVHNTTATWRWTSGGDNSGGAGMRSPAAYQYSTNGGVSWTPTSAVFLTTTPAEGVYSLIVQELDRAGNWSPSSASRSVTIDKTEPVVTITSPVDGFVTNQGSITVSYTEKDGGNAAVGKTRTVNLSEGSNTVTISSVADAAGNTGSANITVWRRGSVLFVRSDGPVDGNGSSWSNSFRTLQAALAVANSTTRKQIWMGAGTFKTPSSRGFVLTSGVSIYGGFGTAGMPNSLAQRDSSVPYRTILSPTTSEDTVLFAESDNWDISPLTGIILNTLRIEGPGTMGIFLAGAKNFLIANMDISGIYSSSQTTSGAVIAKGTGVISNCNIHHNGGAYPIFWVHAFHLNGETGVQVNDCIFSDNSGPWSIIYMWDGDLTFNRTRFLDYGTGSYQVNSNSPYPSAVITFKSCTLRGGRNSIGHSGTVNYDGTNIDL